jgi:Helicase associated domain
MEVAMTDIALPAGLPTQEPHNQSYLASEQLVQAENDEIAPAEPQDDSFENPEVSDAKDEMKDDDEGVSKEETSTEVAVEATEEGVAPVHVELDGNAPKGESAQAATAAPEGNPEEAIKEEGDQSTMETHKEATSASNTEDKEPGQPNGVAGVGGGDRQDSKPAASETDDAGESKLPEGSDPPATDGEAGTNVEDVEVKRQKKNREVLKRPQELTTVVTRNGKTWNEMFDALAAYKERFGDCCVADRFKWEGVCLGLWVRNQRRREASLTDEQHRRLTSLGLDWQTQNERFDATWHERYAKLTEYRVENG